MNRKLLAFLLMLSLVLVPFAPVYSNVSLDTVNTAAGDNDMPLMIGDPYDLWDQDFFGFAQPTPFNVTLFQPDGSSFEARLNAMELGGQLETLDQYTILADDEGWWVYADLVDGDLVASADKVGKTDPSTRGKKLGWTKNIFAGEDGNDLRDPVFDAVRDVYSPNNSIFATQAVETVVRNYVVLLVEFQDVKFAPHQTREWFESQLTGFGTNPTGTLSEYYYENSYGKFLPIMDVYGPFTSDYNLSNYDYQLTGGRNVAWMINNDIGPKATEVIDWRKYDNTRAVTSGYRSVDMIVVVQAGPGKEATGIPGQIWSHATTANYRTGQYDEQGYEIRLRSVNINPGQGFNVGVVCHEMGHSIGEPDYYNTSGTTSGSGEWDLMASGSWLGNDPAGSNPSHHNPFVKGPTRQGWITPQIIAETTYGVELRPRSAYPDLIEIPLGGSGTGSTGSLERIYIEFVSNREPSALFDKAVPGSGLLIWHYDAGGAQTNSASPIARMRMRVEEYDYLDGTQELGTLFHNRGEPTDPWFDTSIGMTPYTLPSTNRNTLLSGTRFTGWHITNISVIGDVMTFDIIKDEDIGKVGTQRPKLLDEPVIAGTGEASVWTKVHNYTNSVMEAAVVDFWVERGTEQIKIASSTVDLPVGATNVVASWPLPFAGKFKAWATVASQDTVFDAGTIRVFDRQATVLLVDDDDHYSAEEAYEGILTALGVPYVMVTQTTTLDVLSQYELVIWNAGQAGRVNGQLTLLERNMLKAYLNAGGKLWMNSPRLGAALNTADAAMLRDYFGATYPRSNQNSGGYIIGLGHDIGGTDFYSLRAYPGRSIQDYLIPTESNRGTSVALFEWTEGFYLGTEVLGNDDHNNFHVVYFGFCMSQIVGAKDRLVLGQEVLDRFGIASAYLDNKTYLVQSATGAKIYIRDPGATDPVAYLYSDATPDGYSVKFNITGVPGTYMATVNLQTRVSSGNSMRVNAVDTLVLKYVDSSGVERWSSSSVKSRVDTDFPATIHHDKIFSARDNEPLEVMAVVTDDISVRHVELFYRIPGAKSYTRMRLQEFTPGAFMSAIPARSVTPMGLEYYLVATDSKGNLTYHSSPDKPQYVVIAPRTLGH